MANQTITINLENAIEVAKNLKVVKQGDLLIMVVDTTVDIGPSASGKMIGNTSTGGFTGLPGGLKGNIYIGKSA